MYSPSKASSQLSRVTITMYEAYYGLREEPFRLSPDSRLCYMHSSFKKARAYMHYALQRNEGFVMVTGRPGTGKTTLVNNITSNLTDQGHLYASIVSTQVEADDLLRLVVLKFGLKADTANKADLIQRLETFLIRLSRENRRPLLIIDEAQDLTEDSLEELRLMTNVQKDNQPLLQIFLVGQEQLRQTVLSPSLEQLHQRIVAACHLETLDEKNTESYVLHRLSKVGWSGHPTLDTSIYREIHQNSLGIPRVVNQICSRLFLHGMVQELHSLGVEDVKSVIEDLTNEQLLPIQHER